MKKQYMTPATEWVLIDQVVIMAGSGPSAGDQANPTVGSRDFEDLWDDGQTSPESGLPDILF